MRSIGLSRRIPLFDAIIAGLQRDVISRKSPTYRQQCKKICTVENNGNFLHTVSKENDSIYM